MGGNLFYSAGTVVHDHASAGKGGNSLGAALVDIVLAGGLSVAKKTLMSDDLNFANAKGIYGYSTVPTLRKALIPQAADNKLYIEGDGAVPIVIQGTAANNHGSAVIFLGTVGTKDIQVHTHGGAGPD